MIAIISLLTIIALTIIITRIATMALTHTGLSREVAKFQARSALSGVGFTTSESENIVNHPVRRRVILLLMLVGNIGIVTVISSLIITFVSFGESISYMTRFLILISGVAVLIGFVSSKWVDRKLSRLINWSLRRYTHIEVQDYSSLLHLAGEYSVTELYVEPEDWLANRTLLELDLVAEGILILGITRKDGTYIGTPLATTKIEPYDNLILYGRGSCFKRLDQRRRGRLGDREHEKAVEEQLEIVEEEIKEDPAEKS